MVRLLAAAAVVALAATPALAGESAEYGCGGMKNSASAMAPMTPAPSTAEAGKAKTGLSSESKATAGQTASSGSKTRPAQ